LSSWKISSVIRQCSLYFVIPFRFCKYFLLVYVLSILFTRTFVETCFLENVLQKSVFKYSEVNFNH
jgi:hypothetical protein